MRTRNRHANNSAAFSPTVRAISRRPSICSISEGRGLMNVSIFARAIAFIALGWLILTSGLTLTHGHLASPRSAEPAIPLDLLALDLLRCAELGSQATADPGCKAAWAQS